MTSTATAYRLFATLALAWGFLATVYAQAPRQTIDQVLRAAERAGAVRIVGIDFDRAGHWDVYHVQNGRMVEWRLADRNLAILRREAQRMASPTARLDFRGALAALRRAQAGTVTSQELERDDEKGVVWSGLVRSGPGTIAVYLHGRDGRVVGIERPRPRTDRR